ncbi:1-(5-phosphoribosyl)-5-[(5-phosphoribosylamino)methylideneamino]imidazole-4-carboxamide isomerase [Heyndrickxia sp. FSL K6-6286]|uniref:1-(5-phosphoribosyl)-5-[(5- phosphoribosylamino)methylideneamino]imidazole-4- carboxamide isomerase n=1 Tax=Heyndrickxia sp. FSL K6-6286 TaxID=2921510 RepID=UPI00217EBE6F|nr:1-(5-phosphoribosyl)-5-[(5-phosphoribosylamino)methylideneamino]imidazole-4-carboxamide isomerase [Heyndrickxia oleronia]
MRIIPAIDLINGKCVRLYQGDFRKTTEVASDPLIQIQQFIEDGAELVHIVDLDGARRGTSVQFELIRKLVEISRIPIQVGGGIRDLETIDKYICAGVARLVLGTAAIEKPGFLQEALKKYHQHIVIGIDAKNGKVATSGWENISEVNYLEFAKKMEQLGVETIIYTDISKDGTMSGPNLYHLEKIVNQVGCKIIASGGIRHYEDILSLSGIGITDAIVGKAIYDGKVSLRRDQI